MRITLSFLAAALSGLAAASPALHGYEGYGYGRHAAPSGSAPSEVATSVIPSSSSAPAGTGGKPSGTKSHPVVTPGVEPSGTKYHPVVTPGVEPSGTKSHPVVTPPGPSLPPTTITVTGDVTSTTTITRRYTSTTERTLTKFVPQSTPVATQGSTVYYSSYLTVSYSTTTLTYTKTAYEVICPRTTPTDSKPTGAPGHGPGYVSVPGASHPGNPAEHHVPGPSPINGAGPDHGHAIPSYPAHTSYAPQVGHCPPAQVVYSTVVIEVTKTKTVEATSTPTTPHVPYHSSILPPAPGKPNPQPPYPIPSGSTKPVHPTGTGKGTGVIPLPTGTAAYHY
jgi:hypothetical protein